MSHPNEEAYRKRIAELEAENTRLNECLEFIKAERKALRDELYGEVKLPMETTEEEYLVMIRNHQPGSTARILAEVGISPRKPS